ncbi:MAG: hypothetical protein WAQ32_01095 [Dethiobacteria bacterium]|nr:hypothetical protein [Bacillota bacterium]
MKSRSKEQQAEELLFRLYGEAFNYGGTDCSKVKGGRSKWVNLGR